jgi:hypothetical protein
MSNPKLLSIVVTLDDQGLLNLNDIQDQLKAKGMHIGRVMPKLGTISGTALDLAALRSIAGVESVSIDHEHKLPPSNQKIQ